MHALDSDKAIDRALIRIKKVLAVVETYLIHFAAYPGPSLVNSGREAKERGEK
jgi:hypothetical protein